MSHPVLWPRSYFYAIGNAPAICLTDNIPAEQSANVLLLGCGDPRNILYTLHTDPPIPRNVLLLTLIHDGHRSDRLWDIFYHIKIDKASFALVISQSKKLLDFTGDLDTWNKSSYSGSAFPIRTFPIGKAVLEFRETLVYGPQNSPLTQKLGAWCIFYFAVVWLCTKFPQQEFQFLKAAQKDKSNKKYRYTISQLRRYLELYTHTESYSRAKHDHLFSSFTREFEAHGGSWQILPDLARSAGPFAKGAVQILTNHFHHYWKTGTISRSTKDIAAAVFVNPTLFYSESCTTALAGDHCTLHYGTFPLQGFHLAPAFLSHSSSSTDEAAEEQLVLCAKSQFQDWCSAFQATVSSPQRKLTIRLLAGDVLAFCRKLSKFRGTPGDSDWLYVSPWKAAALLLDGDMASAPTSFDMIDTSNLSDHVGLLNVLVAAVPLLAHRSTSVLYTELVLQKAEGDKPTNFEEQLCADIPTIAVLLGISPAGCISQCSSISRVHDILMGDTYRERIAWKRPYPTYFQITGGEPEVVTPSFSHPPALATLLFSIYKQMFADEDIAQLRSRTRIPKDIVHYNRGTFAALLGLVKSRIRSDWTAVMELIFDQLHIDQTRILGSNNYQEFCCQLYLRGVYCVETLGTQHATLTPINRRVGLFKGWKAVPPVVCLVLVVPRDKIQLLEGDAASPMFQCNVRGKGFHNIFSCVQATLGTASIQGSGSDAQVRIAEDPAGWSGTSPLVISVLVPAFNLVVNSEPTKISLGLHSTPRTSMMMIKDKLGPFLTLFTVDVMDRSAVLVTVNRPDRRPTVLAPTSIPATLSHTHVSVGINGCSVATMTARWETTADELKLGSQTSPSVIRVAVNDSVQKDLVYPFPVDSTRAKVRIARKSGWIEIEAPVRSDSASTLADLTITSRLSQDRCPVLWSIHRVNLASFPLIEGKASLDRVRSTIESHCRFAFSDLESVALMQSKILKPVLVDVKGTIVVLFRRILESNGPRVVLLSNLDDGGRHTVLYCNGIRMDLAAHTFVVDACILPLTDALMEGPLGSIVVELSSQGAVLATRGDEVEAWKHLLVAFTERCRSWTHKPTCKYATLSKVPASVNIFENPLCGCGEGIDLGRLSLDKMWKNLAPFMTRAAISPLFALPYLERMDPRARRAKSGKSCAACQTPELADAKLLKCGGCKEVEYCGKACQQGHWKEHKKICKSRGK
ncbi:hypothetical protein FB451DRAFT_1181642 [Mycena latifolia]|nr:hypothetical protein FB451DRAFT_1181642 [Mycena latifolia]